MSIFPDSSDGYYDDHGRWQRTKFCFMDCGARCTCKPPNGMYYNPSQDKSMEPETEKEHGHR